MHELPVVHPSLHRVLGRMGRARFAPEYLIFDHVLLVLLSCCHVDPVACVCVCFFLDRDPDGMGATAVPALKGGKVVGIVVTNGGKGYTEVNNGVLFLRLLVWMNSFNVFGCRATTAVCRTRMLHYPRLPFSIGNGRSIWSI